LDKYQTTHNKMSTWNVVSISRHSNIYYIEYIILYTFQ
jgi:predicted SPOUT superfamily RNA methylase MTH1